jgi:hypothetical protein
MAVNFYGWIKSKLPLDPASLRRALTQPPSYSDKLFVRDDAHDASFDPARFNLSMNRFAASAVLNVLSPLLSV